MSTTHPDADLLALCTHLRDMAAEWQRFWAATPDELGDTPADRALEMYALVVWPGSGHPVASLLDLHPLTWEGLQAKAAAVLAALDASDYTNTSRDDLGELMESVLVDIAGASRQQIGRPR